MNKVKQLSFVGKEIFCGLDVHNLSRLSGRIL